MSDCGVCLSDGSGEYCDVWDKQRVRARKPHKCYECGQVIPAGTEYIRIKSLYEGTWDITNTCAICAEIRETFYCQGELCGELWGEMNDHVFPSMTTGCLDRLKTAAAKTELLRRWNEWKFA